MANEARSGDPPNVGNRFPLPITRRASRGSMRRLPRREQRALAEMARGVAHDFNNVLSAVMHGTQLARVGAAPEAARALDLIQGAAERGAETVRRLAELTRQRQDRDFALVDLGRLVEEVVSGVAMLARDREATIVLSPMVEEGRGLTVWGDEVALRGALSALLENAIESLERGGHIRITLRTYERRSEPSRSIEILIEDDGCGMSDEVLARAAEPFFSTHVATKRGLGLSLAVGVVERHLGTLFLDSAPGTGTRARVRLPGGGPRRQARRRLEPPAERAILLVEDDDASRETTKMLLEQAGLGVEAVASVAAGLSRFAEGKFGVVLTDLGLPDGCGWEVARRVKERSPRVKVALVTGWGAIVSDQEGRRRGIDLVLRKPVLPCRLVAEVERLLGGGRP